MPIEHSVLCPVLIGRAFDLESLDRTLQSVAAGKGQTILIAGEAGIGKTRLVAETKAHASLLRFSILQGNCFEHDRALPFAPLIDLLHTLAVISSPDEIAQTFKKNPALTQLLPEFSNEFPGRGAASLLEPEQEKRRLFQALSEWIIRLAGRSDLSEPHSPLL
ncbi:MAG TPA: AAA family ATPase, partial [Anaerolineae bacterium]